MNFATGFTLAGAALRHPVLRRSQRWSEAKRARYVRRRLEATLAAAARIPFYAARFGGTRGPDDLADLPVLPRDRVAELNASARASTGLWTRFFADASSGSTGMPVEFLFDARHQRGRFAARARYLLENGWSPLERSAWIVFLPSGTPDGELVARRRLLGARFLSHLTDFDRQAEWLCALDPVSLYTFPSNLEGLLDALESSGRRPAALARLFCGAEVLDDDLRERVRQVLGIEAIENYGSTEAFLAWQCPRGRSHVNAEHVVVEVADARGNPVAPGEMGRVLVTTLENEVMPLVRYEIGDYAVAAEGHCACGRTLPLLGRVLGRAVNLFRRPDGSLFTPWSLLRAAKDKPGIRQFQIVQRSLERFAIRYVGDEPLPDDTVSAVRADLAMLLPPGAWCDLERVDEIPRTRSGKYLTAVCEIPPVR